MAKRRLHVVSKVKVAFFELSLHGESNIAASSRSKARLKQETNRG